MPIHVRTETNPEQLCVGAAYGCGKDVTLPCRGRGVISLAMQLLCHTSSSTELRLQTRLWKGVPIQVQMKTNPEQMCAGAAYGGGKDVTLPCRERKYYFFTTTHVEMSHHGREGNATHKRE